MMNMRERIPTLTFWISLCISIVNMIVSIIGFSPALTWYTGLQITPVLAILFAFIIVGILVLSWINSFMSNYAGMLIYWVNLLFAPFGYHYLGLPYWLGIVFAASPLFLYFGVMYLSDWLDTLQREKKE